MNKLIENNKIFVWIAVATLGVLLIPLSIMLFGWQLYDPGSGFEIINWGIEDFIVMGAMLYGFAGLFVVVARKVPAKKRLLVAIISALGFFWLWAELAVGVFTNWGS